MKRRTFLTALALLPFAGEAAAAIANDKPRARKKKLKELTNTLILSSPQKDFCDITASRKALLGGRACGKTTAGAADLLLRCKPGERYLVVAPTYHFLRDSTLRTFRMVAEQMGLWDDSKYLKSRECATLRNGAIVDFASAECDLTRFMGGIWSGAWFDEPSLVRAQVSIVQKKEKCFAPPAFVAITSRAKWATMTFSPRGRDIDGRPHWTKQVITRQRWPVVHCSMMQNLFLPDECKQAINKAMRAR